MITGYKKLTGKYLKSSKKKTLLTIVGIVLSVALISTIGLFFKGIQVAEIDDIKNKFGSYHIVFKKLDATGLSKVINNPKVSRYGFCSEGKKIDIDKKVVVSEISATDKALELLPYKAKQGKLPDKSGEVAIEKWVLDKIDNETKLGGKITLDNKTYTLVGTLENSGQGQMENKGIFLTKNNNMDKANSMLLVEISKKANLKDTIKELKKLGAKEDVLENGMLITLQGGSEDSSSMMGLYITIGIIVGIVLIATIAVIYNSFQISVVERIKQYGLLMAVGATPKQIKELVLREATVLATVGVPIGLICSIVAIHGIEFVFKIIGKDSVLAMKTVISPSILALSALIGIVSIYLSALVPAIFASRTSPLAAISSRAFISKDKIKRKNGKFMGKIFGFEGTLAHKNIKRSKKRYRITVFSIVISVVLFITFKSFMDMSLNLAGNLNESKNIHFSVIRNNHSDNEIIDNKMVEDIKNLKSVDKVNREYETFVFDMALNKKSEVKEVKTIKNVYEKATLNGEEKTLLNGSSIAVYDKEALGVCKKYLKSGNIDIDTLNKDNGVILIDKYALYNEGAKKTYVGPIANIKVGDEIDIQQVLFESEHPNSTKMEFGKGNMKKIKVDAIIKDAPFDYSGNSSRLKIITTEAVAKNLTGINDMKLLKLDIKIKDIKNEERAKTEIQSIIKANSSLTFVNKIDNNRRAKSDLLMIKILIYGFVIVIALISSVNIINTLTTNVIIRKKEFATLRSIGLTQKGLKKMIVLEGLLYGIIGSIYGSIIGCGISYLLCRNLNSVREFGWKIPWDAMAIAGVAAIVIGYISVLSPLSRIKKENLIESVREDY